MMTISTPSTESTVSFKTNDEEFGPFSDDSKIEDCSFFESQGSSNELEPSAPKSHIYMLFDTSDIAVLIAGMIASVGAALAPSISSILMGRVFDVLSNYIAGEYSSFGTYMQALRLSSMAILGLGAALIPFTWISITCWMQLGECQSMKCRRALLGSYLDKPILWYEENEDIMGNLTQTNRCVEELRAGTAEASALTLQNIVCCLALIGTSFYYSWSVTLVTLASAPLIILFSFTFSKLIEKYARIENQATTQCSKILDWSLSSPKLVRLCSTQDEEFLKFSKSTEECRIAFNKFALMESLNMGILRFIMLCMFVQGFWFGSSQVRKSNLSSGHVLTCFSSCLMLAQTVKGSLLHIITLQKAHVAMEKIQKFLQIYEAQYLTEFNRISLYEKYLGKIAPVSCQGNIVFQNVSFAYPNRLDNTVLKNISLTFPAGSLCFLVGRSGSGKSTLSNLLLNFYSPLSGVIKIDNVGLTRLDSTWLVDNITVVEQSCTLFNDTIRNNILLGKADDIESVTDEQLKRACQISLLEEVIRDLDNGLETVIGSNGVQLSGGQIQRVALARAVIRDTPILILDESVSALDIVQRELIIEAIKKWRRGKTTIVLTHEYSQIAENDYVYLMEDGKVVEQGYKRDLETGGLFQKMASFQQTTINQILTNQNEPLGLLKEDHSSAYTRPKKSRMSSQILSTFDPLKYIQQTAAEAAIERDFVEYQGLNTRRRSLRREAANEKADIDIDLEKRITKNARPDVAPIGEIMKKMLKTLEQKSVLIIGLLFSILNGAVNPIFSYAFSKLLTGIVPQNSDIGSSFYLLKWSLIVFFLALFDGITTFLKEYLLKHSSEAWICSLRKLCFTGISKQGLGWFNENINEPAEVNALLMNDSRDLRSLVSEFLSIISTIVILAPSGLIWALVAGWKLSLVCISLIPCFIIVTGIYGSALQKFENSYKNAVAELENQMYEIVQGMKTIKTLRLQDYFIAKFNEKANILIGLSHKRSIMTGLGIAVTNLLIYIVQGLLLYYGMRLVGLGEYSSSQLMETYVLLIFSIMSCGQLISQVPDISRGQRAATYIFKILDLKPSDSEVEGLIIPSLESTNAVYFNQVTFAYPSAPNQPMLRNVSFKIRKGEHLAVVGDSGSGKSTLTLLITRLFSVNQGAIFFQGEEINEIDIEWLRENIALVDQKAVFFDGSIYENLTYGLSNVHHSEVLRALRLVNILEFVESLSKGLNTRIVTSSISGGQAQRLSIARALIRKPSLLILDECTSALDAENTQNIADLVKNKLKHEQPDMSIMVITHAEEMMRITDEVLTMKKGRVCERGPFNELMAKGNELYRIVTAGVQN